VSNELKRKRFFGVYDIIGFGCGILNERYARRQYFPSSKNGCQMITVFHTALDNRVILVITLCVHEILTLSGLLGCGLSSSRK
jgi:hypothetical protein